MCCDYSGICECGQQYIWLYVSDCVSKGCVQGVWTCVMCLPSYVCVSVCAACSKCVYDACVKCVCDACVKWLNGVNDIKTVLWFVVDDQWFKGFHALLYWYNYHLSKSLQFIWRSTELTNKLQWRRHMMQQPFWRLLSWAPSQYKDRLIYVWWFPC